MQVELPEVREAMIGHDKLDQPSLIIMDSNGVGLGLYQDLCKLGFQHLLPDDSILTSKSDNLKMRRFNQALYYLYDGLVQLPVTMPGLDALLEEIAAFPDGKHDDQVDAFCMVAAYFPRVVEQTRVRGGLMGR